MERSCPFITLMKSSSFCYFLWIFENVVESSLSVSFCNFINYVMLLWSFLNSIFELVCLFLFLGKYNTAWKESKYGVISGPYFPAFGLKTKRYFVSLGIQSKCGKIRTRNNPVFGRFSRSAIDILLDQIKAYQLSHLLPHLKVVLSFVLRLSMWWQFFEHISRFDNTWMQDDT